MPPRDTMEDPSINIALLTALQYLVPFGISLPVAVIANWGSNSSARDTLILERYYENPAPLVSFGLTGQVNVRSLVEGYFRQLTTLFLLPHAPSFLSVGGLVARLAHDFGPSDLLSRFAQGPSIKSATFVKGDVFPGHRMMDYPSKGEIETALGTVYAISPQIYDRSIWPPMDVMIETHMWNGVWDDFLEDWFQKRLKLLETGPNLFTPQQWRTNLKRTRPDVPLAHLEEIGLSKIRDDLARTSPYDDWNNMKLTDLGDANATGGAL